MNPAPVFGSARAGRPSFGGQRTVVASPVNCKSQILAWLRSQLAGPAPKRGAELQVGSSASFARAAAVASLRHRSLPARSSQFGRFKSKTREAGAKPDNRTQYKLNGRSAG